MLICGVRWTDQNESESVMGGLYLGVAVAGVEALIAMGLVIAFM